MRIRQCYFTFENFVRLIPSLNERFAAHGFYQFTGYLGLLLFAAPAFVRLRTRNALLSILGRKRKKPAEASLFLFA